MNLLLRSWIWEQSLSYFSQRSDSMAPTKGAHSLQGRGSISINISCYECIFELVWTYARAKQTRPHTAKYIAYKKKVLIIFPLPIWIGLVVPEEVNKICVLQIQIPSKSNFHNQNIKITKQMTYCFPANSEVLWEILLDRTVCDCDNAIPPQCFSSCIWPLLKTITKATFPVHRVFWVKHLPASWSTKNRIKSIRITECSEQQEKLQV